MTAPRGRRGAGSSGGTTGADGLLGGNTARGALLIVAAAVVGVLLLGKGLEGGQVPSASGPGGGTATTVDPADPGGESTTSSSLPTPTTHAPAEVKVVVLNGAGTAGIARAGSNVLIAQNFVARGENTAAVAASVVYYAPEFEADAAAVAALLGITAAPAPVPATLPAGAAADDEVVVVLGPDFTPPAT